MTNSRIPKKKQGKVIQELIQDSYENLFSGQGEPPAYMTIREIEALQARVKELEAQLKSQNPAISESSAPQPIAEVSREAAADQADQTKAINPDETGSHEEIPPQSGTETPEQSASYHHLTATGWAYATERHVADRTRDLELASQVGRAISEMTADIHVLLKQAVELIRERFKLYHTQIFLLDPTGRTLVLRAATGEAGAQLIRLGYHLPIGPGSLNGRAASEKHAEIVSETSLSSNFLPNPQLPNTRSEMAVPLITGGEVLGVLDMQSDKSNALSETNLPAFEALAGQLAVTIQNAALFAEVEQARSLMEAQVRRLTEQGWQDYLDAIERGQKIGFVFEQDGVAPLSVEAIQTESENMLSIPVTVTGAKVGAIQVKNDSDRTWTANETELVQTICAQLGQHIENLRLLAQAEHYREQAEQAARHLTSEGWKDLKARGAVAPGYVYDLNKVEPLSEEKKITSAAVLKQPLLVRNEPIGELAVDAPNSAEAAEIITAVAEQLSSHIENLRLSELNERNAQREHTLRQITSALRSSTNPVAILRTAAQELGSVLGRKTIVQMTPPEDDDSRDLK
jgi:GAF domain-containing protein